MMEEAATTATLTGLTRLMNSEAPVIVILVLIVLVVLWLSWKLYRKSEDLVNTRLDKLESDLDACHAAHRACDEKTRHLADALLDAIKGNNVQAISAVQREFGNGH